MSFSYDHCSLSWTTAINYRRPWPEQDFNTVLCGGLVASDQGDDKAHASDDHRDSPSQAYNPRAAYNGMAFANVRMTMSSRWAITDDSHAVNKRVYQPHCYSTAPNA